MEKQQESNKKSRIIAICVIISYVVILGLVGALLGTSNMSTPVFLIFLAVCIAFTYKACQGRLLSALGTLPWFLTFLLTIFLSGLIGVFVAPYYIGRWIGTKIAEIVEDSKTGKEEEIEK